MKKFLSFFGHRGADGYPVPSDFTVLAFLAVIFVALMAAFGII